MSIRSILRMSVSPQKMSEVLGFLVSQTHSTRYKEGCISCRVYRSEEKMDEIMVEELWRDEKCLEHHLSSSEYQKLLLLTELSSIPPEFIFEKVLSISGIETIEKARTSHLH